MIQEGRGIQTALTLWKSLNIIMTLSPNKTNTYKITKNTYITYIFIKWNTQNYRRKVLASLLRLAVASYEDHWTFKILARGSKLRTTNPSDLEDEATDSDGLKSKSPKPWG